VARRRSTLLFSALSTLLVLTACGGGDNETETGATEENPVVIYSGRGEELVGPLLDQLEDAVGAPVEVRYADSAELAAQLLEEGERTEADVFFSQDAGALGALAKADMLSELPATITDRVAPSYVDADGRWVATSARARVVIYNEEAAPEATEFSGIDDILDEKYSGQIGYAPTNASFQSFVTALRVIRGEAAAEEWLTEFAALEPVAYEKNSLVLEAVDRGEVALGLVNHYYWFAMAQEVGADAMTAQVHYLNADDPGALINVAGVGLIAGSEQSAEAEAVAEFLVSDEAQQFFADETAEYPVVEGISSDVHEVGNLADLTGAAIDLNDLDSLAETQALLEKVGLI
jgi:iron(III) transport system substrate-binding protein